LVLTSLEELDLTGTRITDAGHIHLRLPTRLIRFHFNGTTVTLTGVVRWIVQEQRRTLVEALRVMGLVEFNDEV
jgi:hypothetical protein